MMESYYPPKTKGTGTKYQLNQQGIPGGCPCSSGERRKAAPSSQEASRLDMLQSKLPKLCLIG